MIKVKKLKNLHVAASVINTHQQYAIYSVAIHTAVIGTNATSDLKSSECVLGDKNHVLHYQ
jgi:hypothetical protein